MTRNEAIKQLEEAIGYIALPRQRLLAKDALRVLTRLSKPANMERKDDDDRLPPGETIFMAGGI